MFSNGDSGGPLIQYDSENNPVLIGVTSASYKCGSDGYPTLFVRVSAFTGFLPLNEIGKAPENTDSPTTATNHGGETVLKIGLSTALGVIAVVTLGLVLSRWYRSKQNS